MDTSAPAATSSKAKLTLWDTTSLIVGIIIGAGIFRAPSEVFNGVNGPWQAVGLWVLGGFVSLLGALCFAELGSTYPRSGGEYVYLTRAFGRPVGFLFAWNQLALIRTAGSTGIIAYAFGEFTSRFFNLENHTELFNVLFAVAAIALFTGVNILGVYSGKMTQNVLTALKILGIGLLLVAGWYVAQQSDNPDPRVVYHGEIAKIEQNEIALRQRDQTGSIVTVTSATKIRINGSDEDDNDRPYQSSDLREGQEIRVIASKSAPEEAEYIKVNTFPLLEIIAIGLIPVLWTYAGWHEAAYVVAEVRQEQRTIPLALLLGTGSVMVIYVAINVACVSAVGFERAGESSAIAADVMGAAFHEQGAKLMALIVMISCLGAINGTIFTSARIFAEMGRDHALFAPLARWNARFGTPVIALLVQGVLSMAMVVFVWLYFGSGSAFFNLLFCTSAAFWVFFFLTVLALFVLRFKDPSLPRPFRVPLYPITPILFCGCCAWMIYNSVNSFPRHSLVGLLILAAGLPLYLLSEWIRRPEPKSIDG